MNLKSKLLPSWIIESMKFFSFWQIFKTGYYNFSWFKKKHFRNQWQMNIKKIHFDEKNENKTLKITYFLNSKAVEESFFQTVYKENENIYIVGKFFVFIWFNYIKEHQNLKIFRVFVIKFNKNPTSNIIQFFSTSPTKNIFKMDARNSPLILSGLTNFLLELKLDKKSILNSYYHKNSLSFTLDEEEEVVHLIRYFYFNYSYYINYIIIYMYISFIIYIFINYLYEIIYIYIIFLSSYIFY